MNYETLETKKTSTLYLETKGKCLNDIDINEKSLCYWPMWSGYPARGKVGLSNMWHRSLRFSYEVK